LFRYYLKWKRFKAEKDSLKFGIPWISFPAIRYLESYLMSDMKVYEYGCGGSTIFFARLGAEVISIEHDPTWYNNLSGYLKSKRIDNIQLKLFVPSPDDSGERLYLSGNENYNGFSFRNYVNSIKDYPDNYFDLIVIDGRARNACFQLSKNKIKNTGLIVWDNSERARYRLDFEDICKYFNKIELPGPTPFSKNFTVTTIFKKKR
jgi:hypothetical protein